MSDQASGLRKIVKDEKLKNIKKDNSLSSLRVISMTSGKGGVGKTNTVGNLAIALSKLGKKVLIFDADLGLANIDIIFGIHSEFDLRHLMNREKSLNEIIVETKHGIKIIPGGSGFANLTALTEIEKLNLISEFSNFNFNVDFVFIDTGAGIASNVIYFNLAAAEIIVIATSEPTSITDAYAMIKILSQQHHIKKVKLLVNMVKDEETAKKVFKTISNAASVHFTKNNVVIEYLGWIPYDENLPIAVSKRIPLLEFNPNSIAGKAYEKLAKNIILQADISNESNIKMFMQRLISYK